MSGVLTLAAADLGVGAVLLVCGVLAWRHRPASRAGLIMVGAALAWFAGSLVGGAVFLHRGPLVHLHLSYPTGHLRRPLATATVVVAYVACIFEALAANSWLTLGLAGLVVLAAGDLFVRSSGPARKAGGPALAAAVAFAGVLALGSANRLLGWDADLAVLLTYYAVICLVSVVLLRDLLWGRWTDATLADLVTDLGGRSSTEGLDGLLQRAVGDPSLVVGYWLADARALRRRLGKSAGPPCSRGPTVP